MSLIQIADLLAVGTIIEAPKARLEDLNHPEVALHLGQSLRESHPEALSLVVRSLHVGLNRTDQTQVGQLVGLSRPDQINLIQSPEDQVVLLEVLEDREGIRRVVKWLRPQVAIATEVFRGIL
jgi:hypothetical protein